MSDIIAGQSNVLRMTDKDIAKVRALESAALELPQVDIPTAHVFHAGVYARTIIVPAGVVLTGAFIKCATLLILNGDAIVFLDGEGVEFVGYHVLPAAAGRKQAIAARRDTTLTMIFATAATTVEAAEEQFTDEAHLLFSRLPSAVNTIIVTGE